MAGYHDLLADPLQRRLLAGSIPADFADWLDYVALVAVIIYVWGHGALELALLAVCFTVPYVTAGPFLAAWVDRTDLKRVLVITNLGRAVATLGMAVAPNIAVLLALVLLRSLVDSAFNPARQAALQALTPEPLLVRANALHQGVNQTSKVVGPALGGALMLALPVQSIFVINGLVSAVAMAVFATLALPPRTAPAGEHSPLWSQFGAGFAEFRKSRVMAAVLAFAAAANFTWFLYDTQIGLLTQTLGYSATALGLSITASGIGGLIGAALAGRFGNHRPMLLMAIPALVSGISTTLLALAAIYAIAIPFWAFVIAVGVMGGTTVFMMVPYRAALQRETPPDRIARVVAAGEAVMIAALMTAPFLGSAIYAAYGVGAPFLAGGILIAILGIVGLLVRV